MLVVILGIYSIEKTKDSLINIIFTCFKHYFSWGRAHYWSIFAPEVVKPELKVEIPLDNGDRSFEDVSENILDKLLLSASAATDIDAPIVNQEEAQDWEESLNELFPDLI